MPHHSRLRITSIDVCVHAGSQHRGIYDTHDTTTAPHTARPFDAVEGTTALSATRFHFMWTCVSADFPPLLSSCLPISLFSIDGVWILLLGSRSPIRHYYRHRAPLGVLVNPLKSPKRQNPLIRDFTTTPPTNSQDFFRGVSFEPKVRVPCILRSTFPRK